MNRTYKTEAIVLKRRHIGETDRLVTVFSKHYGKMTVVARGVRRITSRRASALELFNHTKLLVYRGKTLDGISDAVTIASFDNLKSQLATTTGAYAVIEILDKLLPEGEAHADVFAKTCQFLHALNQRSVYSPTAVNSYKLYLLQTLGFLPKNQLYQHHVLDAMIEDVIERKLYSPLLARA